jgi:AcrR family transcriptional regulator
MASSKTEDILESAKQLFWKFGIKKVSIEEICKAAKVSKMTFYRSFSNKNELAAQVLTNLLEKGYTDYRAIMNQDIAFSEKIRLTILLKHESSTHLSEEFLKDIYQNEDANLLAIINGYREKSINDIKTDFTQAQQNGWIRNDLSIDFLIYVMNNMGEKLFDDNLRAMFTDTHDLIMELTTFFFYGIGLPNNTPNQ